jgi:hypothetical protein
MAGKRKFREKRDSQMKLANADIADHVETKKKIAL